PDRRPGRSHEGHGGEGGGPAGCRGGRMRVLRPRAQVEGDRGAAAPPGDRVVNVAPLRGRALPEGGTIGVPAPASPVENRSEALRGVEWWEARGYRVKLAGGIWDRDAYVAGDPKRRARDLATM